MESIRVLSVVATSDDNVGWRYLVRGKTVAGANVKVETQRTYTPGDVIRVKENMVVAQDEPEDEIAEEFWIPVQNLSELSSRVDKINKRATKLKQDPLELIVHRNKYKFITDVDDPLVKYKLVQVELIGKTPKIEGWRPLASIKSLPTDSGFNNVVTPIGADAARYLPEKFWTIEPKCEHCNLNRRRVRTVLLMDDDGVIKQIGRQCLKDFVGYGNPESLLRMFESIASLMDDIKLLQDPDYLDLGYDDGTSKYVDVGEFMAYAALAIRKYGWVSRKKAEELHEEATADTALSLMRPPKGTDLQKATGPTGGDRLKAQEARDWLLTLDPVKAGKRPDDVVFYRNLQSLVKNEAVTNRELGFLAYAVQAKNDYDARILRDETRKKKGGGAWLGNVGDKVSVDLTVNRINTFEGDYGTTYFVKCVDAEGNTVTVKLSSSPPDEGDEIHVEGTILKLSEWQHIKETLVGKRAKVTIQGFLGRVYRRIKLTPMLIVKKVDMFEIEEAWYAEREKAGDEVSDADAGPFISTHGYKDQYLAHTASGDNVIAVHGRDADFTLEPGKSYKLAGETKAHINNPIDGKKYTVLYVDTVKPLKKAVVVEREPDPLPPEIPGEKSVRDFLTSGDLKLYLP